MALSKELLEEVYKGFSKIEKEYKHSVTQTTRLSNRKNAFNDFKKTLSEERIALYEFLINKVDHYFWKSTINSFLEDLKLSEAVDKDTHKYFEKKCDEKVGRFPVGSCIVLFNNPNQHNYPLNVPLLVFGMEPDSDRAYFVTKGGTIKSGNCLPATVNSFRVATKEEIAEIVAGMNYEKILREINSAGLDAKSEKSGITLTNFLKMFSESVSKKKKGQLNELEQKG
jgi:hypothetical protein